MKHDIRQDYDELNVQVAIDRVRSGDQCPPITTPERRAVTAALTGLGWSVRKIAKATGVCERSVRRYRANGST